MYIVMHQAARTFRKASNKQRECYDRRAKENIFKVGGLMLYKNQHRTKLTNTLYAHYKIMRKHANLNIYYSICWHRNSKASTC